MLMATTLRTWGGIISALLGGRDLSAEDTFWAMDGLVRGEATSAQVAGFLVALRAKGRRLRRLRGWLRLCVVMRRG
ncbi:hypothetical protein [Kribbella sancticallisti]|uniref:hypothetical protein n=1 Tax=Kribbella sancticallisti TaxID=460087 RepID=UPI0031D4DAEA